MERRWNASGRVRMRLRRLPSEDERFRRAAAAVAAVRHVGMSAARPVAHCAAQSCAEPRAIAVLEMPRGQRRRRESNRAQRAGRVLSRPIGATFAMRIVKERGERREVARVYLGGFGFGCVGTACVRLKRVTCPHPAACRARSPMRWRRRAPSAAWILLEPRSNPDLIPRERRAPRRPVSPAMRCGPPNAGRMFRAALYLRPRYCSVQMCVKCLIDVCARICALSRYATTNAYGL